MIEVCPAIILRYFIFTISIIVLIVSLLGRFTDYVPTIFQIILYSIYQLGLNYDIKIKEDNNVHITMTITTPNRPEAQTIPEKVADVVSLLKGVNELSLIHI